jgi:hypothetical protein
MYATGFTNVAIRGNGTTHQNGSCQSNHEVNPYRIPTATKTRRDVSPKPNPLGIPTTIAS